LDRLLVVFTRLKAVRGVTPDSDEFVEDWGGPAADDHRAHSCQGAGGACTVLVVHGHGYGGFDGEAQARAAKELGAALAGAGPAPAECGLVFHPPTAWGLGAERAFAEGLRSCLEGRAGKVRFVLRYSRMDPVLRALAPRCRAGQDFAEAFAQVWDACAADLTAHLQRLYEVWRTLDPLQAVNTRLQTWVKSGFAAARGDELAHDAEVLFKRGGLHGFAGAKDSIEALVADARAQAPPEKTAAIEDAWRQVRALLPGNGEAGDALFQSAARFVSDLRDPQGRDRCRDELRGGANPFREWWGALDGALRRLARSLDRGASV
jgi:hypothetical protein